MILEGADLSSGLSVSSAKFMQIYALHIFFLQILVVFFVNKVNVEGLNTSCDQDHMAFLCQASC